MVEIALLPCPFCGFDKPQIRGNGIGDFYVLCESDDDAVYCCGASSSGQRCETESGAADRWNKRPATPAARWRADGKPDPTPQDYERAQLPLGQYSDDELANAAYLTTGLIPENLSNAAKQRMRWLSRRLCEAEAKLKAYG